MTKSNHHPNNETCAVAGHARCAFVITPSVSSRICSGDGVIQTCCFVTFPCPTACYVMFIRESPCAFWSKSPGSQPVQYIYVETNQQQLLKVSRVARLSFVPWPSWRDLILRSWSYKTGAAAGTVSWTIHSLLLISKC